LAPEPVADAADPRLALYRGVRDPELLRDHGLFVAEGRLVVQRLLERSRLRPRSVVVTPAARDSLGPALDRAGCPVYVVSPATIEEISGFNIHRGCLALGERPPAAGVNDLLSFLQGGPLLVLERIGNPDNIGGIFRNAAALGASGVVLSPGCSDPLYRKSIRTSMGATLHVPFATAREWPADLLAVAGSGRALVALTPDPGAEPIDEAVRKLAGNSVALFLGHEGSGISSDAAVMAPIRARIPMLPGADSLNVASACAIALHVFAGRAASASRPAFGAPRRSG
jgi:tRNA G18 (ribose-2'-O)-methylase SpoU